MNPSSYKIYNASAGSGKTFTLVKEYLKILFQAKTADYYKHILAITFTNKAVAEMKARIIGRLKEFSNPEILSNPTDMFSRICEELDAKAEQIHNKSKAILNNMVYNYAAFEVSTIDGFMHKLIRIFAFDLKLPVNFEVELDQELLLNEAVDSLVNKAGFDAALTKILVDFAIEKANDDKSWDVSLDFYKIAKLLINENDKPYIETLKGKTPDAFKNFKKQLAKTLLEIENNIVKQAQNVVLLIDECGLQFDDFTRGSLPNHFQNLANKKFDIPFSSNWQDALINKETLYPKRVTESVAAVIDDIQPQLMEAFSKTKTLLFKYKLAQAIYKNLTPLSVLSQINSELKTIKDEQNKLLISEFNSIISNQIKDQPTPFIYERIGEKFKHYFIDEFQDTSVLQWQNLIPLLNNALSVENGSVLLVGDAKQAIYRWRGGKAEQFIDLYNGIKNPFFIKPALKNLPSNYRSFKEIVIFNNAFFNYLATTVFSEAKYKNLYENAKQEITTKHDGFVNISFFKFDNKDDGTQINCEAVLETIKNCESNDFKMEDICVLVRTKKQEKAIASFLASREISIVSSETLLLQNAPSVQFINRVLALLVSPNNTEIKMAVLEFFADCFEIEFKHDFFKKHLYLETPDIFESLKQFGITINYYKLTQLALYDLVEELVRVFKLAETANAYIQFYLDVVFDFFQKKGSDLSEFLAYFEKKKHSLSIVSPKQTNAVQIMTIHKAKGLEFPVVIFPFANIDIYKEQEPKEWMPLKAEKNNDFSHVLLNYTKDFEHFNAESLAIYNKHQAELELDNINLLYVALTRPIEQLHIVTKYEEKPNTKNTYSAFLINFLEQRKLWSTTESTYSFGNAKKQSVAKPQLDTVMEQKQFISTAKESHNIKIVSNSGKLWDTSQQRAIEKGNLIHAIMSQIVTKTDINFVLHDFLTSGELNSIQAKQLRTKIIEIVDHPELKIYFDAEKTIYNERDIISKQGIILRPDRLVINSKNEAVIIDYKTGLRDKLHRQQLQIYQDVLEEMHFKVIKKILIYINETIRVVAID